MNDELTALINKAKAIEAQRNNSDSEVDDNTQQCHDCHSQNIFYDNIKNSIVCMDCGYYREVLLLNNDYKGYQNQNGQCPDKNRCSAPINNYLPKSSMGTSIVGGRGEGVYFMKRLHSQNNKIPYSEKKRYETIKYVRSVCHDKLPTSVVDLAIKLIVDYVESSGRRGKNRVGMIMAATWLACRERGIPRSIHEISDIYSQPKTILTKGNKLLMTILREKNFQFNASTFESNDYLARYCSKLGINKYQKMINKIFEFIKLHKLVQDNNDNSIMAASIMLVAHRYHLEIQRSVVSSHCKVSEVTIYKCYKKLRHHKDLLNTEFKKYEKK